MPNRKDAKGRVLKAGESQRKDGSYMYRYTDIRGERRSIYAPDLKKLREKEQIIQKDLNAGIDYRAGNTTVIELVQRYLGLKKNLRKSTLESYSVHLERLAKIDFAYMKIRDVKRSDVQKMLADLNAKGLKTGTIKAVTSIVRPAFQMAYEEDIIRKDPFSPKVFESLPNDKTKREPLTPYQQKSLLEFARCNTPWNKYYDLINVLLGTGMRVGEFCGLTVDDIDFENRRISINKQIACGTDRKIYVEPPKTDSGVRFIPIIPQIYCSLKNLIEKSQQSNVINIIDGYHGFIAIKPNKKVMTSADVDMMFKRLKRAYNREHPTEQIKMLTPHVLRHTFCTNMANSGMDIKSLQYVMGHSDVSLTLNVYAHSSYEQAALSMFSVAI